MKALVISLVLSMGAVSHAGFNTIIQEIDQESIRVDPERPTSILFRDRDGEKFFLNCPIYRAYKTVVFSHFKSAISPMKEGGCREAIAQIHQEMSQGKELQAIELEVTSENRREKIDIIPHFR